MDTFGATISCKNVETLPPKTNLSCFKSLLGTGLWDIILTSLLPPIQSCSSKFWAWSCIASNFDKGWRGDHKHKIDHGQVIYAKIWYSVSSAFATGCSTKCPSNSYVRLIESNKGSKERQGPTLAVGFIFRCMRRRPVHWERVNCKTQRIFSYTWILGFRM